MYSTQIIFPVILGDNSQLDIITARLSQLLTSECDTSAWIDGRCYAFNTKRWSHIRLNGEIYPLNPSNQKGYFVISLFTEDEIPSSAWSKVKKGFKDFPNAIFNDLQIEVNSRVFTKYNLKSLF